MVCQGTQKQRDKRRRIVVETLILGLMGDVTCNPKFQLEVLMGLFQLSHINDVNYNFEK